MANLFQIAERMDEFAREYGIPKHHWGSLRLMGSMFYALGMDPANIILIPLPKREMVLGDIMEVEP